MFDLNDAIAKWRRTLEEGGIVRRDVLDELESHLRDEVDQLIRSGVAVEEAFGHATRRLGKGDDLNEEFSKLRAERSGLMQLVNGEVLAMSARDAFRANRSVVLSLFMGFCGIIGWLGASCVLTNICTAFRHATGFWQAAKVLVIWSLFSSFFLIFAIVGLRSGLRLLRQRERKVKLIACSLIPALALSPVYVVVGAMLVLFTPVWYARLTQPDNVVQLSVSPDGRFEAYVVDEPCIDPPNHRLYVRSADHGRVKRVAKLLEDYDSIKEIHWSPHSDVVVFHSRCFLIAVQVSDFKTVKIPEWEWNWRKPRWPKTINVAAIEFPKPGTFSYRPEDYEDFTTIEMGVF